MEVTQKVYGDEIDSPKSFSVRKKHKKLKGTSIRFCLIPVFEDRLAECRGIF